MATMEGIAFIILLVTFISSIPLTWLSKHAWRSKKLFILFSALGVMSFILMTLIVWPRL